MGGSSGLSVILATSAGGRSLSSGTHSVALNSLPIKKNGNEKSKIDRNIRIRFSTLGFGEQKVVLHINR
jgi:hypothetical protein